MMIDALRVDCTLTLLISIILSLGIGLAGIRLDRRLGVGCIYPGHTYVTAMVVDMGIPLQKSTRRKAVHFRVIKTHKSMQCK